MSLRSDLGEILDPIFERRVASDRALTRSFTFPYSTVDAPIDETVALEGDARAIAFRRTLYVHVWQNRMEEDQELPKRTIAALDGAIVEGRRLRFRSSTRVPDPNADIVHDALTLTVTRLAEEIS